MSLPAVILASSSPRRSELLRGLGVEFRVVPSDADEAHNEQLTATEISQLNAYRKARSVAKKFPDALVLGADTLVYLETTLLGKPRNLEDAYRMLKQLQGKTHEVVTGVCLLQLRGHRQTIFAESTRVKFRALGAKEIRDYMSRINPLDKAGAYAIQEHGDKIVESISGSLTNVIGLPVERLQEEFTAWQCSEA
jgi:septum formation protein